MNFTGEFFTLSKDELKNLENNKITDENTTIKNERVFKT